jgi:NAD(P)-dependent dehydrogenase (short-subunit alcohol dehydrogenase family)
VILDITGEVAVITGAAGKLGQIWCRALASAGASVVGLDVAGSPRSPSDPGSGLALWASADVTNRRSLRAALDQTLESVGPPSILVNNAGIDQPPSAGGRSWLFEDIPDEVSAAVLDVNALGVLRACQTFGAEMVRQGRGSVINIGSIYASQAPDPRLYEHIPLDPPFLKPPSYGMSKAGVAALTRYLAALWGPHGVRVNTLSPGGVLADQDETFRKGYISKVPLGRMADASDLTGPLLFLASDMSGYVSGQELVVDGGLVCW